MIACLLGLMIVGVVCALADDDRLIDHGVAVPLAECRGVVTTQTEDGRCLAIACSLDLSPRGWILVTDIDSGQTQQVSCPEGIANAAPYGSMLASTGKFYTAQGRVLLEFDPDSSEWTFQGTPSKKVGAYLWMTEAPDGVIWCGGYGGAGLTSFNPQTREMTDHGLMDDKEQYLSRVACGDDAWIYCGIGTSHGNLVAYNPAGGERVGLVPDDMRVITTGTVYRGVDGKVYGQIALSDRTHYYRMWEGAAEEIEQSAMAAAEPNGSIYWGQKTGEFPDGRKLADYDLVNKWLSVSDADTNTTKRIEFDYVSEGSVIRVMTGGPDGKVYGNSAHPSRNFVCDPEEGVPSYREGAIAVKGYGVQGNYIFGGHYGGGVLYVYDVTKPWTLAGAPARLVGGHAGKELLEVASSDDGKLDFIDSYGLVLFRADGESGSAHFDLQVEADGRYYVIIAPYQSPGYGQARFSIDGNAIGEPYVGYSQQVQPGPHVVYGPLTLTAGKHRLTALVEKAGEGNPWIGITQVVVTQQEPEQVATEAQTANPELVARFAPDINVPWGAAAHADGGEHILISGQPGYGYVGGGIGIFNLKTREEQLLKHTDLIEYHSVMAMAPLPDGDIVCGTTISGGHGAAAVEKEAVLFVLDWETKTISLKKSPMAGAKSIGLLRTGSDGLVYGTADATGLFVFDPATGEVVHRADITEYGGGTVNGMEVGEDGNVYLVRTKAVIRVKPGTFEIEKLCDTPGPANAGTAIKAGRIWFAVGTHLWSCGL